jgi:hypothetical protein
MGRLYDTAVWRRARAQALHDAGWRCSNPRCGVSLIGKGKGAQVHHRKALKLAPALALEPQNLRPLCDSCHATTEMVERKQRNRPALARPRCRVMLVCGPPAAGKTTYVREHAAACDIVIDLDVIVTEMGVGRERSGQVLGRALDERNRRLAALAHRSPHDTAWVILTAASARLRAWWCSALGVKHDDVVLLVPLRATLRQRIIADPQRRHVATKHLALVDEWFERENANDPGFINSICDSTGLPLDPLHPWQGGRV